MKTIKEFYAAVTHLAEKHGAKSWSVSVLMNTHFISKLPSIPAPTYHANIWLGSHKSASAMHKSPEGCIEQLELKIKALTTEATNQEDIEIT